MRKFQIVLLAVLLFILFMAWAIEGCKKEPMIHTEKRELSRTPCFSPSNETYPLIQMKPNIMHNVFWNHDAVEIIFDTNLSFPNHRYIGSTVLVSNPVKNKNGCYLVNVSNSNGIDVWRPFFQDTMYQWTQLTSRGRMILPFGTDSLQFLQNRLYNISILNYFYNTPKDTMISSQYIQITGPQW